MIDEVTGGGITQTKQNENDNDAALNSSRGSHWFSGRESYKYKCGATQAPGRASYNNAAHASRRASHNDATRAPGRARGGLCLWKIHWHYIFLVLMLAEEA